jgi:hypothetical protein
VNGRYLSLATPRVERHKSLTKNRPIGSFRPTGPGAYVRRLAGLHSGRAAAGVVARTLYRKSTGATSRLRRRMLFLLVKTFSQTRVGETPAILNSAIGTASGADR